MQRTELPPIERDLAIAGPCISCGNPLTTRDQFCPACGRPRGQANSPPTASEVPPDQIRLDHERSFACGSCGAEVTFGSESRSTVCPFCDVAYVAELPASRQHPRPEFIIGFAITAEQAREMFRSWLSKNPWFRPGDLATQAIEDKLRGVYVPFWSFAARVNTQWSARIGEYWYETQTYTVRNAKGETETRTRRVRHTEWWPLEGRRHDYWWGHFVPAGRGVAAEEVATLMPYRTEAMARFRPQFLAGWLCEESVIEMEAAWTATCEAYSIAEERKTQAFLPGDTYDDLQVQTQWDRISEDLVLLPVHIVSYRYQDKVYRFVVNGQTGKCGGEKPISGRRIAAVVIIALVLIAIVVLFVLSQQ